jgi:hypothetical protein
VSPSLERRRRAPGAAALKSPLLRRQDEASRCSRPSRTAPRTTHSSASSITAVCESLSSAPLRWRNLVEGVANVTGKGGKASCDSHGGTWEELRALRTEETFGEDRVVP